MRLFIPAFCLKPKVHCGVAYFRTSRIGVVQSHKLVPLPDSLVPVFVVYMLFYPSVVIVGTPQGLVNAIGEKADY